VQAARKVGSKKSTFRNKKDPPKKKKKMGSKCKPKVLLFSAPLFSMFSEATSDLRETGCGSGGTGRLPIANTRLWGHGRWLSGRGNHASHQRKEGTECKGARQEVERRNMNPLSGCINWEPNEGHEIERVTEGRKKANFKSNNEGGGGPGVAWELIERQDPNTQETFL